MALRILNQIACKNIIKNDTSNFVKAKWLRSLQYTSQQNNETTLQSEHLTQHEDNPIDEKTPPPSFKPVGPNVPRFTPVEVNTSKERESLTKSERKHLKSLAKISKYAKYKYQEHLRDLERQKFLRNYKPHVIKEGYRPEDNQRIQNKVDSLRDDFIKSFVFSKDDLQPKNMIDFGTKHYRYRVETQNRIITKGLKYGNIYEEVMEDQPVPSTSNKSSDASSSLSRSYSTYIGKGLFDHSNICLPEEYGLTTNSNSYHSEFIEDRMKRNAAQRSSKNILQRELKTANTNLDLKEKNNAEDILTKCCLKPKSCLFEPLMIDNYKIDEYESKIPKLSYADTLKSKDQHKENILPFNSEISAARNQPNVTIHREFSTSQQSKHLSTQAGLQNLSFANNLLTITSNNQQKRCFSNNSHNSNNSNNSNKCEDPSGFETRTCPPPPRAVCPRPEPPPPSPKMCVVSPDVPLIQPDCPEPPPPPMPLPCPLRRIKKRPVLQKVEVCIEPCPIQAQTPVAPTTPKKLPCLKPACTPMPPPPPLKNVPKLKRICFMDVCPPPPPIECLIKECGNPERADDMCNYQPRVKQLKTLILCHPKIKTYRPDFCEIEHPKMGKTPNKNFRTSPLSVNSPNNGFYLAKAGPNMMQKSYMSSSADKSKSPDNEETSETPITYSPEICEKIPKKYDCNKPCHCHEPLVPTYAPPLNRPKFKYDLNKDDPLRYDSEECNPPTCADAIRADDDKDLYVKKTLAPFTVCSYKCVDQPMELCPLKRLKKRHVYGDPPRSKSCDPLECEAHLLADSVCEVKVIKKKLKPLLPCLPEKIDDKSKRHYSTLMANKNVTANFDVMKRSFHTSDAQQQNSSPMKSKFAIKSKQAKVKCSKFNVCCPPRGRETCGGYKYKDCSKVESPYASFSELNCQFDMSKTCECSEDQPYLQPRFPVLLPIPHLAPITPRYSQIDPKIEEDCIRKQFGMENEGLTKDCDSPVEYVPLRKKDWIPTPTVVCRVLPNPKARDLVVKPCPVVEKKCNDKVKKKSKKSSDAPKGNKSLNENSPQSKSPVKLEVPPNERVPASLSIKRKSIWQQFTDYFKARPNCPSPDEWKRKLLRERAEQAARAAGLEVIDPNLNGGKIVEVNCKPVDECTTTEEEIVQSCQIQPSHCSKIEESDVEDKRCKVKPYPNCPPRGRPACKMSFRFSDLYNQRPIHPSFSDSFPFARKLPLSDGVMMQAKNMQLSAAILSGNNPLCLNKPYSTFRIIARAFSDKKSDKKTDKKKSDKKVCKVKMQECVQPEKKLFRKLPCEERVNPRALICKPLDAQTTPCRQGTPSCGGSVTLNPCMVGEMYNCEKRARDSCADMPYDFKSCTPQENPCPSYSECAPPFRPIPYNECTEQERRFLFAGKMKIVKQTKEKKCNFSTSAAYQRPIDDIIEENLNLLSNSENDNCTLTSNEMYYKLDDDTTNIFDNAVILPTIKAKMNEIPSAQEKHLSECIKQYLCTLNKRTDNNLIKKETDAPSLETLVNELLDKNKLN